jgi:hypothetical protein
MQLIPFVHAFYAFESFMLYNHHNYENNVTIIPFAMGELRRSLGRGTICFIVHHSSSYLFPSIIDNIHIIGRLSIVSFTYEHFQTEFHVISLSIQPHKCVAWSPFGLSLNFNTPS